MSLVPVIRNVFNKQNRALLRELVITDFKLRYQGSVLGYAWSLLKPLLLFLIMYVVFVKFLRLGASVPHFPVYLLLGIVMWSLFTETTSQSLTSIVDRGGIIRKIRIPRWIIVLTSSTSALINFILNMIVVGVFLVINGVDFSPEIVWFPVILLELYLLALGVSLLLSALFVKYRDVSHIWEITTQGLFYLTPILYPLSLITNATFQKLILLNPAAQAIQDGRNVLITKETLTIAEVFGNPMARLLPLAITFVILIIGILYFRKEAKNFAENL
ncbi:MAG TPA: ABC transporter permease [Candidatus Saccharimonadales bacterium]|nr:ABC transporter permease [Candidatus Saccharimonadales bacterium]